MEEKKRKEGEEKRKKSNIIKRWKLAIYLKLNK